MSTAIAAPAPLSGKVFAKIDLPREIDDRLKATSIVGETSGYPTLQAATDALRGITAGDKPSAAVFQQDGKFYGYGADWNFHPVKAYALGMVTEDPTQWRSPIDHAPKDHPYLVGSEEERGIAFKRSDVAALIDGDQLFPNLAFKPKQ